MTAAELISNSHPVLAVHEVALYQGSELPEFLRALSASDLRALLSECDAVMGACWQESARRRTEARWNGAEVDVEDIPEPQQVEPPEPTELPDEIVIVNSAREVVRTVVVVHDRGGHTELPRVVDSSVGETALLAVTGAIEMPAEVGPAEPVSGPAHAVPDVAELAHAEGVNIALDGETTGLIGPVVEVTDAGLPKRRPSPRPRPADPVMCIAEHQAGD